MPNTCPLCKSPAKVSQIINQRVFHSCEVCFGVFLDRFFYLNFQDEKMRYELHQNNVEDERYQKFVSPITSAIVNDFLPENKGLDFGAGTGPVIAKVLKDQGFGIELYDPVFHNYPETLEKKYDYIACCEVIEHFHHPEKEFKLLKNLLRPDGKLYCMTEMFHDALNFEQWYYKNDPTHVFFYQKKTMEWIKNQFGFSQVSFQARLITFSN